MPLSKWPLCGALTASRNTFLLLLLLFFFFLPPLTKFDGDQITEDITKTLQHICGDRELRFCFMIFFKIDTF